MASNAAVRIGNDFSEDLDLNLVRFGVRYTGIDHSFKVMFGKAKDEEFYKAATANMSFFRLNVERTLYKKHKLNASFIYKSVDGRLNTENYEFSSIDLSALYTHEYKERFYFSGLAGVESYSTEADTMEDDGIAFKIGVNAALKF